MVPLLDELLEVFDVFNWLADKQYWSSPVVERLVVIDSKAFQVTIYP